MDSRCFQRVQIIASDKRFEKLKEAKTIRTHVLSRLLNCFLGRVPNGGGQGTPLDELLADHKAYVHLCVRYLARG